MNKKEREEFLFLKEIQRENNSILKSKKQKIFLNFFERVTKKLSSERKS